MLNRSLAMSQPITHAISAARVDSFTESPSTVASPAVRRWSPYRWSVQLAVLSLVTLLVHGFHPLSEDGGLYVAGAQLTLNPGLFPHFTEFVSAHLRYSVFAPVVAAITRATHLPLLGVLFVIELLSIALMLAAARAVLRRVTENEHAQFAGIALLAAMWTVPIAGTSLLLMDPYLTARSLSAPLSLWALAFALDDWRNNTRSLLGCILCIALSAAIHPLMAGYALGVVLVVRSLRSPRKTLLLVTLALLTFAGVAMLQTHSPSESGPVVLAAISRYYWFLSEWHWYELFGLLGPLLVLFALRFLDRDGLGPRGITLATSAILYGCFAAVITAVFAHQNYEAHIVARMQPLRAFLIIYVVMLLLLGASLQQAFERMGPSRLLRVAVAPIFGVVALAMLVAQRSQFPASPHVELPWRLQQTTNPWVRAFLWSRDHTPQDALFALDAHYVTTKGEDAQIFRAIAERSSLPDFSKDGGEAAITPRLAEQWAEGYTVQLNLNELTASQLRARLAPYPVSYVILQSNSPAVLDCPYDNGSLRVCRLQPK